MRQGSQKTRTRKLHSRQFHSGKKYKGLYEVVHTSGSTGTAGIFVYGPNDWSILKALVMARVSKTNVNFFRKTRLAYIGLIHGHYAGIGLAQDAPKFFFDFLPIDINEKLDDILSKLNVFQPQSLGGYSSGVYMLAQEQLSGRLSISPKRIICSADPLTPNMKSTIERAFGVEPIDFYAASESVCIASQCDSHGTIHIFSDWHGFDIVDQEHNSVSPGNPGNLILTTLYNYTQPLIRYKMNDELILGKSRCKCHWPFPEIEEIAGREEEFLWFERADNSKEDIHPLSIVAFMVQGLEKFQVIQTEKNRLLMKVVVNEYSENIIPRIRNEMKDLLSIKGLAETVNFDVEIVDEIKNDPVTGKFKLIIPYRG